MTPIKVTGRTILWLKVPTADGRWITRTSGTKHAATARKMEDMLRELGAQGLRAWDVLGAIEAKRLSVPALWDLWISTGRDLHAIRERLDDTDLAPLLADFETALTNRKQARSDTVKHYVAAVRTLIPEGEPFRRSQLTPARLQAWIDGKAALSAGTIYKHGCGMRIFCDWLRGRGDLATNPMADVRVPSPAPPRCKYLDTPDAIRLADAQPEPYRTFSALLHATGMDVSTALELRRRDVNVESRMIFAPGTKTWTRKRMVRVADWGWPYVEARLRGLLPDARLFEEIPDRWTPRDVHDAATKALVKQGHTIYAGYWQRDARHTWAVRCARAGVPLHAIARQLGHKDTTLVAKVYGIFAPSDDEMARYEALATAADALRHA